eukprot:gene14918-biopygen13470
MGDIQIRRRRDLGASRTTHGNKGTHACLVRHMQSKAGAKAPHKAALGKGACAARDGGEVEARAEGMLTKSWRGPLNRPVEEDESGPPGIMGSIDGGIWSSVASGGKYA